MSHRDPAHAPNPGRSEHGQPLDPIGPGEQERFAHVLGERFATHAQAAAAAVRRAEQDLEDARGALSRAREAADSRPYRSDRRVFVRAALEAEAEALTRKTSPKAVRAAYRHLLDRAVDLAEAEVQGYHSDEAERQRERDEGVEACLAAEQRAIERLDVARAMQQRVHQAERTARQGLAEMVERLARPDGATGARGHARSHEPQA